MTNPASRFTAEPCPACGCTARYHSNGQCVDCIKRRATERAKTATAKEYQRVYYRNRFAWLRGRRIGADPADLPPMPHDGRCECCGEQFEKLNLDHDYELEALGFTGVEVFRGWICTSCNVRLGTVGDNLAGATAARDRAQQLVAYLRSR